MNYQLWVCTKNCDKTISQIIGSIVACNLKVSHSAKVLSNNQVAVVPLNIESSLALTETRKTITKAIADLPAFFVLLTDLCGASWDLPYPTLPKAEESASQKVNEKLAGKGIDTSPKLVNGGGLKVEIIPPATKAGAQPAPGIPPITLSILETLNKVVNASCYLSDVFFDGVTKEERVLLSETLHKMLEGGFREGK